jgi:hypothetical protein
MLTSACSAVASPQDGTDSPGRPPVQRLGSLNASRSASPAVRRGAPARGKKGPIKPTFTGRRSKEDRAALEKEALERERERTHELRKKDERKARDAENKAKREATRALRGRGGYTGAMSGPFSLGSSKDGKCTVLHMCDLVLTVYRPESQPPHCFDFRFRIGLASDAHQRRGGWWRWRFELPIVRRKWRRRWW